MGWATAGREVILGRGRAITYAFKRDSNKCLAFSLRVNQLGFIILEGDKHNNTELNIMIIEG
ncbi:hypothetical protein ACAM_1629 [Aeropyrum camini SY1 = JCM 12091]|uniref:Uncharacterized protein n=1 Tax=Aeropyrum camini SY1 = JCM 12091 TaxID=1198449 RepID=U3TGG2_9CREN|nr:hypothetical protein ACAM_1629 [Aeropyrum camini SY1 = JCM 12091]